MKKITDDIIYVGVNDHKLDIFEGQFYVPNGMAYNSYLVMDEKISVFDAVDVNFAEEWLENIDAALEGKQPDYLIVQHMEPDHSGSVMHFVRKYPDAVVVANSKTFVMMESYFGAELTAERLVVADGGNLSTGKHSFTFVLAPMVHWPEVMVTYDSCDKVLFSADGFGKFGALDVEEEWDCEARRYYFGIVGKFGVQVQALLKKAAALDIQIICPLHGPVLTENLGKYLKLYDIWSSYEPEEKGVTIAYTSVYGNTKKAILLLEKELQALGCTEYELFDLARCDMMEAVESAFKYDKLVLATTTYNGGIFPYMHDFIHHLNDRNYQNRFIAFMENGSWSPVAAANMKKQLEGGKQLQFAENLVTIRAAVTEDNEKTIRKLAEELMK